MSKRLNVDIDAKDESDLKTVMELLDTNKQSEAVRRIIRLSKGIIKDSKRVEGGRNRRVKVLVGGKTKTFIV